MYVNIQSCSGNDNDNDNNNDSDNLTDSQWSVINGNNRDSNGGLLSGIRMVRILIFQKKNSKNCGLWWLVTNS